ncbi:hypothetical protein [Actinomadura coerulea]|uniref:hypothetical protein n=1 Tax=Actinomadura coerulea TaxID=46159 RepID=UPI0034120558
MKFIGYGLLAIMIGALAGTVFGGFAAHLVHTVQAEMLHGCRGATAGCTGSGLMAAITGPGVSYGFIAGGLSGFFGYVGARVDSEYRASHGGAAARDTWGRFVGDGVVLAIVCGIAVFASVGDLGVLTGFTAIVGFAAGAGVGAFIADV